MADDRDALIATLTEEGWVKNVHGSKVLTAPNGWHIVPPRFADATTSLTTPVGVVAASFAPHAPNAAILAAARAAVEAEQ